MLGDGGRGRLQRRVQRATASLLPSIELPWMPPWGPELSGDLVDLLADVAVLQADVAGTRLWARDDDGARRRHEAIATMSELRARCASRGLVATATALRELSTMIGAWETAGR